MIQLQILQEIPRGKHELACRSPNLLLYLLSPSLVLECESPPPSLQVSLVVVVVLVSVVYVCVVSCTSR